MYTVIMSTVSEGHLHFPLIKSYYWDELRMQSDPAIIWATIIEMCSILKLDLIIIVVLPRNAPSDRNVRFVISGFRFDILFH